MNTNNEPRMSQREKELTAATRAGMTAAICHDTKPDQYKQDAHISQAWDNGYRIRGEQMGHVFKYAD